MLRRTWIFAPLLAIAQSDPAAAFLRGKALTAAQLDKQFLWLFHEEWCQDMGQEPTAEQLARLRAKLQRTSGTPPSATSNRTLEVFVRSLALNYQCQSFLFRQHQGRVALSAFGNPVAIDATVAELQRWEVAGKLRFQAPAHQQRLFQSILNMRGDGLVSGKAAEEAFRYAPWEDGPRN
ncbi:MAG: hypothetical protein OHK0021_23890 [Bryobacter sp.]